MSFEEATPENIVPLIQRLAANNFGLRRRLRQGRRLTDEDDKDYAERMGRYKSLINDTAETSSELNVVLESMRMYGLAGGGCQA